MNYCIHKRNKNTLAYIIENINHKIIWWFKKEIFPEPEEQKKRSKFQSQIKSPNKNRIMKYKIKNVQSLVISYLVKLYNFEIY